MSEREPTSLALESPLEVILVASMHLTCMPTLMAYIQCSSDLGPALTLRWMTSSKTGHTRFVLRCFELMLRAILES